MRTVIKTKRTSDTLSRMTFGIFVRKLPKTVEFLYYYVLISLTTAIQIQHGAFLAETLPLPNNDYND